MPSTGSVTQGAEQVAIPDVVSVPLKVTVTGALRNPRRLPAGVATALVVGLVESFLIVTDWLTEPEPLEAVHMYVTPLVFDLITRASQPSRRVVGVLRPTARLGRSCWCTNRWPRACLVGRA